ncbi:hypothetical protein [Citrobacter cronae]|uniref:hypothetical protein n=1 Tax=Citrobacter cronae TaxID=1748967 RepID=UPI0018FF84E0|nr:hypothetical protein [Citrobacter cronae]MBJ8372665.1 hypothetical protein [Citrobacter cronae]
MDAGSGRALQGRYLAPGPVPGGMSVGDRGAAIFPPGAGIVKGVAKNALYTFTGIDASDK